MIEIKNLTKKFDTIVAVNDLSITFKEGVYGIIGENGAGKSTLLRLISGVYLKDKGEILVDGIENDLPAAKNLVFFLSDNPYYELNSNIKQTIDFYASVFPLDKERCFKLLKKLNLPNNVKISKFSKGMRRQFFLMMALSMDVKYLLLDEAFDGIDLLMVDEIKEIIVKLAEEKVILVSSHNTATLQNLCNNFVVLTKGKIVKDGTFEDLASTYVKYQIVTKEFLKKQDLIDFGINVISYKTLGSVINFITDHEINIDEFNAKFSPYFIENIPLDDEEVIKVQMLIGREKHHE